MNYQVKNENLQKIHEEMKRLIEIEKDDRSPKIVRDAALNSYVTIVKMLCVLDLPTTNTTRE